MAYIRGEGRNQSTLFPVVLDDLVPSDHMCRVLDAFVEKLDMSTLGFDRAEPADTGRPGYDPRAMLKLYLYGYFNQIRSSRRLEAECRRNVEVMWLLERLNPDYKSIAEFRRLHREAVTAAGAELVRFAKAYGGSGSQSVGANSAPWRASIRRASGSNFSVIWKAWSKLTESKLLTSMPLEYRLLWRD